MTNVGNIVSCVLIISITLFTTSCQNDSPKADISGIESDVKIKRFEKDLVQYLKEDPGAGFLKLRNEYGTFFNMFTHQVMSIPEGPDATVASNLVLFATDPEIQQIYSKVDSAFENMNDVKADIDLFLRHYRFYYPEKHVPEVVTYISAFNYAVITTDSVIGIGLDMFLGANSEFYPRLGIPKYMSSKFIREYIVPSVIKGWFQSDYEQTAVKKEFLSQMVYQGKLLYYLDAMAPSMHDTLKTGYSSAQLKWVKENETKIWSFFIEKKLLFSTDASEYAKFINDGPPSSGFSPDAPAKLGAWIGWQIVKTYMEKNSEITLDQLLLENDALKILEQSGYKPKK